MNNKQIPKKLILTNFHKIQLIGDGDGSSMGQYEHTNNT